MFVCDIHCFHPSTMIKSSTEFEIQNLKEELATSQRKLDKYAHLSAIRLHISRIELIILSFTVVTLYDELDHLRNNICHSCKKKLVPESTNVSVTPGLSYNNGSTSTHHSRPSTDNPLYRSPSNSPVVPHNKTTSEPLPPVPCEPEVALTPDPSHLTSDSDKEPIIPAQPEAEPT